MSLYNLLHKIHPIGPELLTHHLGLDPTKVGRLRDCFPVAPPLGPVGEVHVLTRTGGGNRAEFEREDAYVRKSPYYVSDSDDEYDSTYALFKFRPAPQVVADLKELFEKQPELFITLTFRERFDEALSHLHDPNSPRGQEILAASKPLMAGLANAKSEIIAVVDAESSKKWLP